MDEKWETQNDFISYLLRDDFFFYNVKATIVQVINSKMYSFFFIFSKYVFYCQLFENHK